MTAKAAEMNRPSAMSRSEAGSGSPSDGGACTHRYLLEEPRDGKTRGRCSLCGHEREWPAAIESLEYLRAHRGLVRHREGLLEAVALAQEGMR